MRAWKESLNFRDLVMRDRDITGRVPAKVIQRAFELKRQLRNIDAIFARVFPTKGSSQSSSKLGKDRERGSRKSGAS